MKDKFARFLFKISLCMMTDRAAYDLYQFQMRYWTSPRGTYILRKIKEDEVESNVD